MMIQIPRVAQAVAAILISSATLLWAAGKVDAINVNRKSVAIHGYDPVAYFEQRAALKGSRNFESDRMGAAWQFATAENKALFESDPERYAPQYGGYCAWAVSNGYTADVDPKAWTVRDGKLYLNCSKGIRRKWLGEVRERIAAADRNWPKLHR